MISRNPFARVAYLYSGSPWMLWLMPLMQSALALSFLFLQRQPTAFTTWLGALTALLAIYNYGCLIYYLTHRAEFAANPAKPIFFTSATAIWIVIFTLLAIAIFTFLVLFVWRS